MQDRYTGDIGDFGKLGLLRQFASTGYPSVSTGIALPTKHTTATVCILATYRRRSFVPVIPPCGLPWVRLSVPASGRLLHWSGTVSLMPPILAGSLTRQAGTRSHGRKYVWTDTGRLFKPCTAATLSLSIPTMS